MTDIPRTLPGLLDALWQRLTPSALLTLATQRAQGGGAARMVVLREAQRDGANLTIYTHSQSAKIVELTHQPATELLFWDADASLQARLLASVSAHPGNDTLWDSLGEGSRLNYAQPMPGTPLDAPQNAHHSSPAYLTVLTASIARIDLLHLGETPHARAIYHRDTDFSGQWVAP